MLIASIYHAILLCAIEKFYHIYNQNHHTSLDIEKPKYLWYSKIMKNHHAGPFSHGLKCKKKQLLAGFFNLILLSFELKEAKPLTFLRSFNILS